MYPASFSSPLSSLYKNYRKNFLHRYQFPQLGELLAQAFAQYRAAPPRIPTSTPLRPPPVAIERTYRLHRARSPRFPAVPRAQIPPRMTRMTPCGKCLRVIV